MVEPECGVKDPDAVGKCRFHPSPARGWKRLEPRWQVELFLGCDGPVVNGYGAIVVVPHDRSHAHDDDTFVGVRVSNSSAYHVASMTKYGAVDAAAGRTITSDLTESRK